MQNHLAHIIFISILMLCSQKVCAQYRNASEAQSIATEFWINKKNGLPTRSAYLSFPTHITIKEHSIYYQCSFSSATDTTPTGYVLIAKDKRMPTILAYSTTNGFVSDCLPEHIKEWILGYNYINGIAGNHPEVISAWVEASKSALPEIPPLLGNIIWGQDYPYNLQCPQINDMNCPTGCVATALAQIMCYHQYPVSGSGSIQYKTLSKGIEVFYDFSATTFEWDKIYNTYGPMEISTLDVGLSILTNQRFRYRNLLVDKEHSFGQCYIRVDTIADSFYSPFEGSFAILLMDEDGNFIQRVSPLQKLKDANGKIKKQDTQTKLSIPSSIPDGKYRLYYAALPKNSLFWMIAEKMNKDDIRESSEEYYLWIEKKDDAYMIEGRIFPCCSSEEKATPVATLMAAIGAAVNMDYSANSSGAYNRNVTTGLKNYFSYDHDMFFASPDVYSDKGWHALLQKELQEGRPVFYTGSGGTSSGHAFVIDGMQTGDDSLTYYHVNWGWDGLCNGYYLLNMLRPVYAGTGGTAGSNYSIGAAMLIGMKPDDGETEYSMACRGLEAKDTLLFPEQTVSLCLNKLTIQSEDDFFGEFNIALKNTERPELPPISIYHESSRTISASRGLSNYFMRCQIPAGTPAGSYQLAISCSYEDGTEVPIFIDEASMLTIRDTLEWKGGSSTTPAQFIGVRGCNILPESVNGGITVTIDSLSNLLPTSLQGKMALFVCDTTSRYVSMMEGQQTVSINSNGMLTGINITGKFSKYLVDGDYLIAIGFLPFDKDHWSFACLMDFDDNIWWSGFPTYFYPMTISNGDAIIDGNMYKGDDIPLSIGERITQRGEMRNQQYDLSGHRIKKAYTNQFIIKNNKLIWNKKE